MAFCQTAIRAGASRGLAYQSFRRYHPDVSRRRFEAGWRAAKAAERVFPDLPLAARERFQGER